MDRIRWLPPSAVSHYWNVSIMHLSFIYFNLLCACMHLCVHTLVCVNAGIRMPWHCVWKSEDNSGISPHLSLVWYRVSLFFTAAYTRLAGLQASRDSYVCLPSHCRRTRITEVCYCTWFYLDSGDSNSDTYACSVPTEPPPQLLVAVAVVVTIIIMLHLLLNIFANGTSAFYVAKCSSGIIYTKIDKLFL